MFRKAFAAVCATCVCAVLATTTTGAAATDIVGKKHFTAAAPVLVAVAGFDFQGAGKHDEKLAPGGRVPVLIEAFGHFGHHRALRWQRCRAVRSIAPCVGRRIVDREIDLDKLRAAIGG